MLSRRLHERPMSSEWLRRRLVGVVPLILAYPCRPQYVAAQALPARAPVAIK
jgi:hypothetical protein